MCSMPGGRVGPRRDDVRSLHSNYINRVLTDTSGRTNKNQSFPLTELQMEKNYVFCNPEMPSKTFVMDFKKLPDHFNMQI